MSNKFKTIKEYINQLPEDRKEVVEKIRSIFNDNLPQGFEETINYNMIGYVVPKSMYPDGYHCSPELPLPFISLASQKNFVALYHMGLYADPKIHDWFVNEYPNHCKYKLDMGKSCIRFKKMNDIPYELIKKLAQKMTPKNWIELYEKNYKK